MAGLQRIQYPATIPLERVMALTSSGWIQHSTAYLESTTDKFAIPFVGDGSEIDKIRVRVRSLSQAGTLNCEIQGANLTPGVASSSGLPDGTAITNGTATGAAVTGGIDEVVELTFATNPAPDGDLNWLVFSATSGGTIDVVVASSGDWRIDSVPGGHGPVPKYFDGTDFDQTTVYDNFAVQLIGNDGKILPYWHQNGWGNPWIDDTTPYVRSGNSSNTSAVGVEFVVPQNLTNLIGVYTAFYTTPTDDNLQLAVARNDGTVLGRSPVFNQQGMSGASEVIPLYFGGVVSLTAGDTVRVFVYDPDGLDVPEINLFDLNSAADQETYFNLSSGELSYCEADDPPERGDGGSGTWSTDSAKLPLMQLIFEQDISTISGGGGGGETTSVFMS